jgi:hypothetical protein
MGWDSGGSSWVPGFLENAWDFVFSSDKHDVSDEAKQAAAAAALAEYYRTHPQDPGAGAYYAANPSSLMSSSYFWVAVGVAVVVLVAAVAVAWGSDQ